MRSSCLLLALLLSVGCQPQAVGPSAAPSPSASKALTFVKPERRSLIRVIEQPGTIQPFEQTQLVARLPGYVRNVNADIGQPVTGPKSDATGRLTQPGQLLAELDVPELVEEAHQKDALTALAEAEVQLAQRALAAAEAQIATANSLVSEAKAGLARVQAQYERWESESRRLTDLAARGVIDAQTRDETQKQFQAAAASKEEALSRLNSALSAVRKAQADYGKCEADVAVAQAKVKVAAAEAKRLKALLEFAAIRAPFDGVVTQRHVNLGDFLQPSGGRTSLFTITRLDPVRAVLPVPETEANLVDSSTVARLTLPGLGGATLAAKITRTSWALEAGARTLRAEIDLPNPNHQLRPGMYVFARLESKLPEAWTLPVACLTKQGDHWTARLKTSTETLRVVVKPGHSDGQFTEVRAWRLSSDTDWRPIQGTEELAP